jgi:hypothetical protein
VGRKNHRMLPRSSAPILKRVNEAMRTSSGPTNRKAMPRAAADSSKTLWSLSRRCWSKTQSDSRGANGEDGSIAGVCGDAASVTSTNSGSRGNDTKSAPPTQRPTLRWVFQLLEGMHRVRVTVQGQVQDLMEGLHEVQIKILRWFGEDVCRIYQISPS